MGSRNHAYSKICFKIRYKIRKKFISVQNNMKTNDRNICEKNKKQNHGIFTKPNTAPNQTLFTSSPYTTTRINFLKVQNISREIN